MLKITIVDLLVFYKIFVLGSIKGSLLEDEELEEVLVYSSEEN